MENVEKSFIHTPDIELASTLYTLGIVIDGIYASDKLNTFNEPVMEFYFAEDEKTKQMMVDYYDGKLRVDPHQLLMVRKEIITRMKQEQRLNKNVKSS